MVLYFKSCKTSKITDFSLLKITFPIKATLDSFNFSYLVEKKFKLNDFGCIVLDKFYAAKFMDRFESIEEEKEIERLEAEADEEYREASEEE
mgnify:CR=1 FL=1